jgi:PAS domain S-box-containing protein
MMMSPEITISAIAFLIQLAASILAITNLRSNQFQISWTLTSLALAVMALQRGIVLHGAFTESMAPNLTNQITELFISLLALTAVLFIRPFMNKLILSRNRLDQLRLFYENAPVGYQSLDLQGHILNINPVWLKTMQYTRIEVIGRPFQEFLTPESNHRFESMLGSQPNQGSLSNKRLEMVRKDGYTITCEFEGTVSQDELGNTIQIHFAFRDITKQLDAEWLLNEKQQQIQTHLNQQALLSEVAICLNTSEPFDSKVPRSLEKIGHHEKACRVYIGQRPGESEKPLQIYQWSAEEFPPLDPGDKAYPVHWYPNWMGWVEKSGTLLAGDGKGIPESLGQDLQQLGIRGFAAFPLKIDAKILGFLVLEYQQASKDWNEQETRVLHTLAHIFSNALERREIDSALHASRNRLMQLSSHQQKMIERDRSHFAHEIHDELGQYLTSIHMGLSWVLKQLPSEQFRLKSKIRELTSMTDTSLRQTKKLSAEYRPRIIDDMGLVAAIEWYVKEFEKNSHISCNLEITEKPIPHDNDVAINLFRIIQESLSNIYRHAQATQVRLLLNKKKNWLTLHIEDNGIGISPKQSKKPDSFGILGMEERARTIGARFNIEKRESQGTRVRVLAPLKEEQT